MVNRGGSFRGPVREPSAWVRRRTSENGVGAEHRLGRTEWRVVHIWWRFLLRGAIEDIAKARSPENGCSLILRRRCYLWRCEHLGTVDSGVEQARLAKSTRIR